MDKFAYWTLKVLSYVFIVAAVGVLVMWLNEKDTYSHPATPWVIWLSAILSSLFFSAVSWTLSKIMYNYLPDLVEEEETED